MIQSIHIQSIHICWSFYSSFDQSAFVIVGAFDVYSLMNNIQEENIFTTNKS